MRLDSPEAIGALYIFDMLLMLVFNPNPKTILVLGVGGGDIIKFICKYYPQCHVDAVDISPLMLEVAKEYFYLPKRKHIHLHVCDALEFMKKETRSYDMIFVDLFLGGDFPPSIDEQDFFSLCRRRLNAEGVLAMNTLRKAPQEQIERVMCSLSHEFGNTLLPLQQTIRRMRLNVIFLAFADCTHYTKNQIIRNAKTLDKLTGNSFRDELRTFCDFNNWKYLDVYYRTLFKRNRIRRFKLMPESSRAV